MVKRSIAVPVVLIFVSALVMTTAVQAKVGQPTLTPQTSGTTEGLIAVSPVNPRVVWASGRNGTFVVTTDGGQHWRSGVVPGAEALQFRDVQGFSEKVAYLMSIGNNPGDFRIYKTVGRRRDLDDPVSEPEPCRVLRLHGFLDSEARHCAQRLGERSFS